jgi:hypothetical protein
VHAGFATVPGLNERDGGTVYDGQLFIDAEAALRSRKNSREPSASLNR